MALVHLVIGLVLAQYLYFSVLVGRARGRYGVAAPATTGHPVFERHYRVQMNTLELLVMLVPSLWSVGVYWNPPVAAALGVLFMVGRVLYSTGYVRHPPSRLVGFALSVTPIVLCIGGTVVGAARELWRQHGG